MTHYQLNCFHMKCVVHLTKQHKAVILTQRLPLILVEDLAVTPVHVGHVNGVAICPIDFPVGKGVRLIVNEPVTNKITSVSTQ